MVNTFFSEFPYPTWYTTYNFIRISTSHSKKPLLKPQYLEQNNFNHRLTVLVDYRFGFCSAYLLFRSHCIKAIAIFVYVRRKHRSIMSSLTFIDLPLIRKLSIFYVITDICTRTEKWCPQVIMPCGYYYQRLQNIYTYTHAREPTVKTNAEQ